jgi:hypothetical protein
MIEEITEVRTGMAANLWHDDVAGWKAKAVEKSNSLFMPKSGKRELQVFRYVKIKQGNWADETCTARIQDLDDVSQIDHLCNVRGFLRYFVPIQYSIVIL